MKKYTSPTVTVKFEDSPDAEVVFKHPGIGANSILESLKSNKDILNFMTLVYVSAKGVEVDGKDISEVPVEAWPMGMTIDLFTRLTQEVKRSVDPSSKEDAEKN